MVRKSKNCIFSIQDIWGYQKLKVRTKIRHSKKTGSEGSKLTELDNLVLDAVGRDSPYMTGIDSNATDPQPSIRNSGENSLFTNNAATGSGLATPWHQQVFARKSAPPRAEEEDSQASAEFEFRRPFRNMTGNFLKFAMNFSLFALFCED